MTTSQIITLNGTPVVRMELHVPNSGPCFADCKLNAQVLLRGKVQILWGTLALNGTIDTSFSGGFVEQSTYRVVAGAGGWSKLLGPRSWHSDANVKTRRVATDTANEVGETIGTFNPASAQFTADFMRDSGSATSTLEACAGGVPWWVDFAGVTNVGPRPTSVPDPSTYHILNFDPSAKELSLGLEAAPYDGEGTIVIGSVITDDRFDAPVTVRELLIISEGNSLTCKAWCDDNTTGYSKLAKTFKSLVNRCSDDLIPYKVRYRVLSMSTDGRANLQSLSKGNWPDAILVKQAPGVAGAHAEFTPGCIVTVEFLEGNRSMPVITGACEWDPNGSQSSSFVPKMLAIGTTKLSDAIPAAREGDKVLSGGIGQKIQFSDAAGVPVVLCYPTTPPTPASPPYLVSFGIVPPTPVSAVPLYGAVAAGSKKVGIAT